MLIVPVFIIEMGHGCGCFLSLVEGPELSVLKSETQISPYIFLFVINFSTILFYCLLPIKTKILDLFLYRTISSSFLNTFIMEFFLKLDLLHGSHWSHAKGKKEAVDKYHKYIALA